MDETWVVKVSPYGNLCNTEDEFEAHQVAEKVAARGGGTAEVWRLKDGVWKMFDVYPK